MRDTAANERFVTSFFNLDAKFSKVVQTETLKPLEEFIFVALFNAKPQCTFAENALKRAALGYVPDFRGM